MPAVPRGGGGLALLSEQHVRPAGQHVPAVESVQKTHARSATPDVRRTSSAASKESATPWSVHDGQFFAATFADDQPRPRAPQERRLLQRLHSAKGSLLRREDRRLMREMGVSAATIERYSLRNAELLRVGVGSTAEEQVPKDLQSLGGDLVQLADFQFHGDLLGSLLGAGAFSSVHRATRTSDGRDVAIKVFHQPVRPSGADRYSPPLQGASSGADPRLRPQSEYDHEDAMSFVREVTCLAKMGLVHETIVGYLGHGFVRTDDGLAGFIIMELIGGRGLYDTIFRPQGRTSRLPIASVQKWSYQLSSAVAHLHVHSIVHRDIKETNVMLNAQGEQSDVVLIDLGLAMPLPSSASQGLQLLPYTEMFGVIGYRAPEVHRQRSYGAAVDVFALGRVMYNMLRRIARPPSNWISLPAIIGKVHPSSYWAYEKLYCTPPVSSEWPAALRDLTLRCLAADPTHRPTSSELMSQLSHLMHDVPF